MFKELPPFYYLTHYDQFADHCSSNLKDLLSPARLERLRTSMLLPKQTRAMLVRSLNRKPLYLRGEQLAYDEIDCPESEIRRLEQAGFLERLNTSHFPELLAYLNKADLLAIAKTFCIPLKASTPKPLLLKKLSVLLINRVIDPFAAADTGDHSSAAGSDSRRAAVVRKPDHFVNHDAGLKELIAQPRFKDFFRVNAKEWMSYLLFVYFGDTDRDLSHFSMRDLGVLRSRENARLGARFSDVENAEAAFHYAKAYRDIRDEDDLEKLRLSSCARYLDEKNRWVFPEVQDSLSIAKREKFISKLSRKLAHHCKPTAMAIAKEGHSDDAKERYFRLRYTLEKDTAQRQQLAEELESCLQNPSSDAFWLFCRDFYERKFNKRIRSIYTELLDRAENHVSVDEFYRNNVERKVCEIYRAESKKAWRTENRFWQTLFGLVFWDILYEHPDVEFASEFDRTPLALKKGQFFKAFAAPIMERFAALDSSEALKSYLLRQSAAHYGTPNGIFRWSKSMLKNLLEIVDHIDAGKLFAVLERMATAYESVKDGFPDIATVENGVLIFEEIKAPGDKLRRNQLQAMRLLEESGINTRICKVSWQRDYNQRYVVVDLETTGGRRDGHRITEIGLVVIENQAVIAHWNTLINPGRRIPRAIQALTGITNEMVADAPAFSEVADVLLGYLQDSIFVAHNVNFDFGFIQMELHRLERHLSMPKLCTVRESRENFPGLASYSLKNLCAHFSIRLDQHHRALADAQAAAELLLINLAQQQNESE